MKKIIYSHLAILMVFGYSCASEETSESKSEKTEVKDTTGSDSDTVVQKEIEPRKRLPKHAGSWIDANLDNTVFYSQRVDDMVARSSTEFEEPQEAVADYEYDFLKAEDLKKLHVREVIYYALAYPCSFSQICAEIIEDSTPDIPKISGYLPFSYESEEMSATQSDELNYRRDSVIAVLIQYIDQNPDRIDLAYLRILKNLDAYEAFPVIIRTASEKNLDNYSFLLDYMHHNEVAALRELDFYDKMYGEDSWQYNNSVEATPKVKKVVIKLATAFYKEINGD